jgi:hypothetical protein
MAGSLYRAAVFLTGAEFLHLRKKLLTCNEREIAKKQERSRAESA